jgi:hypothetical protein
MKTEQMVTLLRRASILALGALGLVVWSLIDPRPAPVVIGLSVGQALGSLSFFILLVVMVADLKRAQKDRSSTLPPAPPPSVGPRE